MLGVEIKRAYDEIDAWGSATREKRKKREGVVLVDT